MSALSPRPVSERSYDDFLYDELALQDTHPERIAAIAQLLGLQPAPAPATNCRVLELGCGLGGNIVPMAYELPGSEFVGIDLSSAQIAWGQEYVDRLGLKNIQLIQRDILDVTPEIGRFDYILCHGVYSWVPPEVQRRILDICGTCLSDRGVAYVSFNTYPGWHMRGGLRDMLRREVGSHGTPRERVQRARDFLKLLQHTPDKGNLAQQWLRSEVEILQRLSDRYLFFEHLVDINLPCYFSDFMAAATKAGLQYLGDSQLSSMMPERFGTDVAQAVHERSADILETEQYVDHLEVRYFRRALLCRSAAHVDRIVSWPRLENLWISAEFGPASDAPDLHSEAIEKFVQPSGPELETGVPIVKAALSVLADHRPRGLSFHDLCVGARSRLDGSAQPALLLSDMETIGGNLLKLYAKSQVEIGTWAPLVARVPGARPEASAFVRLQATRELDACTNFRHECVRMDRFDRSLLRQMDGTRTREELAHGVITDIHAGLVSVEMDGQSRDDLDLILEIVDQKLARLARLSLLRA